MVRKFAILLAMVAMYGCLPSQDESAVKTGGTHPVDMQISSYTTAGLSNFLIPSAYAAVSDLQLCFKRLRFKQDLSDTLDPLVEDNIDLNLGLVTLSSAGTDLPVVNVPAGTYYRIEFDLEPECGIGESVRLTNDFGVFNSTERITIKFDGVFVVNGAETLNLNVQDILNAANGHNGSISVRDSLENASGSM